MTRYLIPLAFTLAACGSTRPQDLHPLAYAAGYETGNVVLDLLGSVDDADVCEYVDVALSAYVDGIAESMGEDLDPCPAVD